MKITTWPLLALLFASCTSSSYLQQQNAKLAEFKRDEYVLMNQVTGVDKVFCARLLFIPIVYRSDKRMYERAYARAVKQLPEADGILKPRTEYKKIPIPLILVNFSWKEMTVTGRGYKLKSDEEMKPTDTNGKQ